MFLGHYGVSFAFSTVDHRIKLWQVFLFVQLVDVVWCVLQWLDIERMRVMDGTNAFNRLDLYYQPYSHGLLTVLGWSVLAGVVHQILRRRQPGVTKVSFVLALAVFSHWLLDLLVHHPDLPLVDNRHKVGMGLWDHSGLSFALECVVIAAGFFPYLYASKPLDDFGRWAPWALVAGMLLVSACLYFPPPFLPMQGPRSLILSMFGTYLGMTWIAWKLEQHRVLVGRVQ